MKIVIKISLYKVQEKPKLFIKHKKNSLFIYFFYNKVDKMVTHYKSKTQIQLCLLYTISFSFFVN